VWTPDGKRIVFASDRAGLRDFYIRAADGSGQDELLLKTNEDKIPRAISPDGKYLLFDSYNSKAGGDLWILPLEGDRKPAPLIQTEFNEVVGEFSPDGRWIAYMSNETGAFEVYVKPFSPGPGTDISGSKSTISKGGGTFPHWRGKHLIYTTLDGRVMSVDVSAGKTFQFGVPQRIFQAPEVPTNLNGGGDVTANAKRFLFVASKGASDAPAPFTVVLNWLSALKK
jgi:Tol biopolymer transport system component